MPCNIKFHQRGVSLIEALVALLVLALGVMGLAGIQTRTLVESRTSNARAVALQMGGDLLDRMQANVGIRINPPPANPYIFDWGVPPAGADCMAAPCNAEELASFDVAQWKLTLARLLPGGDARVFPSDTDPTQLGVLIGWAATEAKNEGLAGAAELAQYNAAVAIRDGTGVAGSGVAGINCPAGLICHLVYIRP